MEMAAGSYVIAMTGPGDTQEGMNRLLNALRNLDKRLDEVLQGNRKQDKNLDEVLSGNRKMDAATMKKDPGFCRHPLIPAERVVESTKRTGCSMAGSCGEGFIGICLFISTGYSDCCTGRESFGRSCAADSGL